MTVYDFVFLLVDDSMELTIYDNNSGENLWTGEASEVPDEYEEFEIDAIDPPEKPWSMTVSISYDEEQEEPNMKTISFNPLGDTQREQWHSVVDILRVTGGDMNYTGRAAICGELDRYIDYVEDILDGLRKGEQKND